jgi:methionine-S-sulfoxide reductase
MLLAPLLLASGLFLAGRGDTAARAEAVFAGGSFWCLEPVFESLPGVDSAESGYAGSAGPAPTFEQVTSGTTGWLEAVRVHYHPDRISYAQLLDAYWRHIDPTRADGQFTDDGPPFRTVIFYADAAEAKAAEESKRKLERSRRFPKPIVTEIRPAGGFHRAEAEHQDYAKRNAARYRAYYRFSGREAFFAKAWGAGLNPRGSTRSTSGRRASPGPARPRGP